MDEALQASITPRPVIDLSCRQIEHRPVRKLARLFRLLNSLFEASHRSQESGITSVKSRRIRGQCKRALQFLVRLWSG